MHRSQSVHFQPHRSQARLGGISHWHLPIKLLGSEPGGDGANLLANSSASCPALSMALAHVSQQLGQQHCSVCPALPRRWAGDMTGAEMTSEMANAYLPSLIYRDTNWIFYAGTPVYLVREPNGPTWVLQEMTQDSDPTLKPDNLDQLDDKYKELPQGWTFETKVLTEDLSLDTSRAGGWAAIMRDEFHNADQACGYDADTNANYIP
jgi:hypothetical protein